MFGRMENAFKEFKPDFILVEGGAGKCEHDDRANAINHNEACFISYLARREGVLIEDIEPPLTKQVEYLQSKYQPDFVLAMYLIRQIYSEQAKPIERDFDSEKEMLDFTQCFKDNGLAVNIENIRDILNIINSYLPRNEELKEIYSSN